MLGRTAVPWDLKTPHRLTEVHVPGSAGPSFGLEKEAFGADFLNKSRLTTAFPLQVQVPK